MGLLDRTNPQATPRSVLVKALFGAVLMPALVFLFGKTAFREHWPVLLPVFACLGAGVFALWEWQVGDSSSDGDEDVAELENSHDSAKPSSDSRS